MSEIAVYKSEMKDGIGDLVRATASLTCAAPILFPSAKILPQRQEKFKRTTAASNPSQFDLFYLDTILVTTGWNKNDDIFLKEPVWEARSTAEDKPFNWGHNQLDIIGHITGCSAVADDEDFSEIADDSALDDVPEKFHILTNAVIYKAWADTKQKERVDKLIAEILEDKWFVSMECLFRGFNYGVASANGEKRVIARNEESAFLTKHLRAYGGTGKYDGRSIGRVLTNITFSGKGAVEHPANPESIIITSSASFKTVFAGLGYIKTSQGPIQAQVTTITNPVQNAFVERTMAESTDLQEWKAEKAQLLKELENTRANVAKATEEKIAALAATVEEIKKKRDKAIDDVTAAVAEKDKADKEKDDWKKKFDDTKAALDAEKKTADEYKKATKVQKAGASDEEETAFVKKWAALAEAEFDEVLTLAKPTFKANAGSGSFAPSITAPKVAEIKIGSNEGPDAVNKKGGDSAKTGGNEVAGASAEQVLETAEGKAGVTLNTNVQLESTRAALGDFLSAGMKERKGRNRNKNLEGSTK